MLKMPISDHFRKISAIIAQTAQSGFYALSLNFKVVINILCLYYKSYFLLKPKFWSYYDNASFSWISSGVIRQ